MYTKPLKRQSFEGPEETLWSDPNVMFNGPSSTYPIQTFT